MNKYYNFKDLDNTVRVIISGKGYGKTYYELQKAYDRLFKEKLMIQKELSNRIARVRKYLLGYESYIPEDDIPYIVNMLDGE